MKERKKTPEFHLGLQNLKSTFLSFLVTYVFNKKNLKQPLILCESKMNNSIRKKNVKNFPPYANS